MKVIPYWTAGIGLWVAVSLICPLSWDTTFLGFIGVFVLASLEDLERAVLKR
jgi:hypothetical protein